jgi:hypothetical protein
MTFTDAQSLSQAYGSTYWLINKLVDGLTNDDSLIQPPFESNCLNWILGHILTGRNEALSYLDVEPIWGEVEVNRYKSGSPPITRADQALPLERLLRDFEESQERIVLALESASPEELATVVDTRFGERPVGQHIGGLHWHETYHTGQLEILRALALSAHK